MKEKDAEENPKDRGEKGEGRESADRILMDKLKPDEITDRGNDNRLVEEGRDNDQIDLINPLRLDQEADD